MRKLIFVIIAAMTGLSAFAASSHAATASHAAAAIKIFVYNKQIKTDTAPFIDKGTTLLPIRAVAEALKANVAWNSKNSTVTIRKWNETIILTVGKDTGILQGKPDQGNSISLSMPVQKIKGRVYVPLRFVSEQFEYQVTWKDNSVFIDSPLNAKTRTTLNEGSLQSARELLIEMSYGSNIHYNLKPLTANYASEDYTNTFLFPKGEALRYYLIRGGTISLVEIVDDFLVVSWQAQIEQGDGLKPFLDHQFTDERGTAQKIEKAFFFYSSGIFGESSHESSGRLDLDGKITVIGHKSMIGNEVSQEVGTIQFKLADESRKEN